MRLAGSRGRGPRTSRPGKQAATRPEELNDKLELAAYSVGASSDVGVVDPELKAKRARQLRRAKARRILREAIKQSIHEAQLAASLTAGFGDIQRLAKVALEIRKASVALAQSELLSGLGVGLGIQVCCVAVSAFQILEGSMWVAPPGFSVTCSPGIGRYVLRLWDASSGFHIDVLFCFEAPTTIALQSSCAVLNYRFLYGSIRTVETRSLHKFQGQRHGLYTQWFC